MGKDRRRGGLGGGGISVLAVEMVTLKLQSLFISARSLGMQIL